MAALGGAPTPDPAMGGVDPMMAALGGAPAPVSQFPSTDPQAVGSIIEQLVMMQQADQAALQQQQAMTLMGDPLFEALISGAPLGPGAGQDAQAIGSLGDIAPDPMMPV